MDARISEMLDNVSHPCSFASRQHGIPMLKPDSLTVAKGRVKCHPRPVNLAGELSEWMAAITAAAPNLFLLKGQWLLPITAKITTVFMFPH